MRCFSLEAPTAVKGVFNIIHFQAFHGSASRSGKPFPLYQDYRPGKSIETRIPLEIQRTGVAIPAIFQPGANLVVSKEVKDVLVGLGNIEFLRVKFVKLVNFQIEKYTFDCQPFKDVENIFGELKNDPSLFDDVGEYYELICENPYAIEHTGPVFTFQTERVNDNYFPVQMPNLYPIFGVGGFVCNLDCYTRINQFLDKTFFNIKELEVPLT